MGDITRELARFAVNTTYEDIPDEIRSESIRTFLNWMGCVLGGSTNEAIPRAIAAVNVMAGQPQATVLGRNVRYDIGSTAFLNTLSNFIHSYNDTHLETVAHPTGAVASALMAIAEKDQNLTGRRFLHALIIGIEVECRIIRAIAAPPARCHHGLSTCGVSSVFGAAVAAGIILDLNEQQMVWALGNAAAQASGVRSTHGSMASHVIPAHQSRNGLLAAYLGANDFTCAERSIDGPKGIFEVFAEAAYPQHVLDGIGEDWEFMRNAYKPFPCGIVSHAAIEAAITMNEQCPTDLEAIESVEAYVSPMCVKLADRPNPQSRLEALVSVQQWIAVAMTEGKAGIAQQEASRLTDESISLLRAKVAVQAEENRAGESAKLVVAYKNGTRREVSIDNCVGSHERPMSNAQLDEKFMDLSTLVLSNEKARALLDACRRVENSENVADIIPLAS